MLVKLLILFTLFYAEPSTQPSPLVSVGIKSTSVIDARKALAESNPNLANNLPNNGLGIFVLEVIPDGGFGKAGIQFGDIILRIGNTQIKEFGDLRKWRENAEVGKTYSIVILRSSEVRGKLIWKNQTVNLIAETSRESINRDVEIQKWKEWENKQLELPEEERSFDIKGDRLGMTLEMFKAKHYRTVEGDPRPAPFCSDERPDNDNPMLFYKASDGKAGIVKASTTFPFEAYSDTPVIPTVAGVAADTFIYSFVEGQLYDMTISFNNNGYDQVLAAMREKFGEPNEKETQIYTNGFGVKFEGDVTTWFNRSSQIVLYEYFGQKDQSFMMVQHTELAAKAKAKIDAANPPRADDL